MAETEQLRLQVQCHIHTFKAYSLNSTFHIQCLTPDNNTPMTIIFYCIQKFKNNISSSLFYFFLNSKNSQNIPGYTQTKPEKKWTNRNFTICNTTADEAIKFATVF